MRITLKRRKVGSPDTQIGVNIKQAKHDTNAVKTTSAVPEQQERDLKIQESVRLTDLHCAGFGSS